MRRKLIIITLISSILSIIMILLSYFGIVRYFSLHIQDSNKFVENYSKLDQADKKNKVVISFTTTPEKINKIKPMLNSLLDQTVKVDQIVLNIPYTCNGKKYDIPEKYKDIMNIFRCGKDYGPGTNIIPTLLREGECGTKIIYLNDDQIYGKDFIETLVKASQNHPDKVIYTKNDMDSSGGVLVKPEFFNSSVINREKEYFDDNWFKNHINVDKIKISYSENFKSFTI